MITSHWRCLVAHCLTLDTDCSLSQDSEPRSPGAGVSCPGRALAQVTGLGPADLWWLSGHTQETQTRHQGARGPGGHITCADHKRSCSCNLHQMLIHSFWHLTLLTLSWCIIPNQLSQLTFQRAEDYQDINLSTLSWHYYQRKSLINLSKFEKIFSKFSLSIWVRWAALCNSQHNPRSMKY